MSIGRRARTSIRRTVLVALLGALALRASPVLGAERYDTRLRFRTLRTAHFDIHAHQREEALAERLAVIVERVREKSRSTLGLPRGRVQVILVDQTDLANGWANPVPYNTIEITATPPPIGSLIGNTTDWLELVFTHEYTHILHLDRSRGFMQGVRAVFGRTPIAFPNLFLPQWQIEGIATYQESRLTGQGRVPAGDFRAIVDVAAAAGRFEPIDRASGGTTDWPDGTGAYAYGAYFHQFLADRYGPERIARLADATAGRVPWFGAGAFKKVFGRSERELWTEFRESRTNTAPHETDARARRLTRHGFTVTAPRIAEDGTIFYALADPHGFPALMRLPPGGEPQRVAWRALGGRTAIGREWIVFDQVERVRSLGLQSDLFAVRRAGGGVVRLTRDARAADPDLAPDGRRIVCTVQASGRRALALVDFAPGSAGTPRAIAVDGEADYEAPRWSPDGRRIVAARRYDGAYELVLVDPESESVRVLLRRGDARLTTPSWSTDGGSVLFAAAVGSAPFNIFSIDAASAAVRQITNSISGAQAPEMAPDGTLIYVGYTVAGDDLFSLPVGAKPEASRGLDSSASAPHFANVAGREYSSSRDTAGEAAQPHDRSNAEQLRNPEPPDTPESVQDALSHGAALPSFASYRPWRTLLPTYWAPVIESDGGETVFGAGTAMTDALGRHSYAVDAGWSGHRSRPDWHAAYAYDRWRPTLFASYSDETDPIRVGEVRTRELFAGAVLAFRRLRVYDTFLGGFDAQTDTLTCDIACNVTDPRRDLRSLRGGWLHDTRRRYGYSISVEEGFALEVAGESSRSALGSDGDGAATIVDLRGFHRLFGPHAVLAGRVAAAASYGDDAVRRVFSASGNGGSYSSFDFGRDAIGLLRGFDPEDVLGTRALVANLDVRFPIARPQRGIGSWPLFLHSIHGAAFVDAGHAWDTSFRAADIRSSVGAELSADLVVLHFVRLTVAGGTAWTRDPSADRGGAAFFARVGYAF